MRRLTWVLLPLLLTATCVQAKGIEDARQSALSFLGDAALVAPGLAALVAEAGAANDLDLQAWPAEQPVAGRLHVPGDDAPFIALLRPLRALALAHDARAADLAQRVSAGFDGTQFGSPHMLNDDAYAILALRETGRPPQDADLLQAARFLLDHRNADGGWGWAVGGPSGTDMTGIILAALESLHADPRDAQAALPFLNRTQVGDGYAEAPGQEANCESTAWALRIQDQAEAAPDRAAWTFLLSLQNPDGGFAHVPGAPSNLLCSAEAATVLGLAAAGHLHTPNLDGAGIPAVGAWPSLAVVAAAGILQRRLRQD